MNAGPTKNPVSIKGQGFIILLNSQHVNLGTSHFAAISKHFSLCNMRLRETQNHTLPVFPDVLFHLLLRGKWS